MRGGGLFTRESQLNTVFERSNLLELSQEKNVSNVEFRLHVLFWKDTCVFCI